MRSDTKAANSEENRDAASWRRPIDGRLAGHKGMDKMILPQIIRERNGRRRQPDQLQGALTRLLILFIFDLLVLVMTAAFHGDPTPLAG